MGLRDMHVKLVVAEVLNAYDSRCHGWLCQPDSSMRNVGAWDARSGQVIHAPHVSESSQTSPPEA